MATRSNSFREEISGVKSGGVGGSGQLLIILSFVLILAVIIVIAVLPTITNRANTTEALPTSAAPIISVPAVSNPLLEGEGEFFERFMFPMDVDEWKVEGGIMWCHKQADPPNIWYRCSAKVSD